MTLRSNPRTGTMISPFAARLALAPIAGVVVFLLCVAASHLLRPELDPFGTALSNYGIGAYGYLLTLANVALGLGVLVLAYELGRAGGTRMWRIGNALLYVTGVTAMLSGIFPMDAFDTDITFSGIVHIVAGNLGFFILPASLLLLTFGMRQEARWRSTFPVALALAIALVVVAIALIISPPEIGGLVQRALYVPYLAWLVVIAARVGLRATPVEP